MFYRETDPIVAAKRKAETVKNIVPFYLNKFEKLVETNKGFLHGGEVIMSLLLIVNTFLCR